MRAPKLCHHLRQQLGYVWIARKAHYFSGHWPADRRTPPPEIERQYREFVAAWAAGNPATPVEVTADGFASIDELWSAYLDHCKTYYVKRDRPTSEQACIRDACKIVARLYGHERAMDFAPPKLKKVRDEFIALGWQREYINKQVSRVRRMFRWGVSEAIVPVTVLTALETVSDLAKGRNRHIPEGEDIQPVAWATVEATLPYLSPALQSLIRFHWCVGCRANEAGELHVEDIEPIGDLWRWVPRSYKTEHHDAAHLEYWLGPNAQELIRPLLELAKQPPVRKDFYARKNASIAPIGWLFPTGRSRGSGHWTTSAYCRAVSRAVKRANADRETPIPHWYPLQIRHSKGEAIRAVHPKGIEAVQAALGHAQVETSQIYARGTTALAQEVARLFG